MPEHLPPVILSLRRTFSRENETLLRLLFYSPKVLRSAQDERREVCDLSGYT